MTLPFWPVAEQGHALQECCLLVNILDLDPGFPLPLHPPAHSDTGFIHDIWLHMKHPHSSGIQAVVLVEFRYHLKQLQLIL